MAEEEGQDKDTKWTKLLKKLNADEEDTDHENHDDADTGTKNEDDMVSQNISKTGDGLSMTDRMSGSLAVSMQWLDRNGVIRNISAFKIGYIIQYIIDIFFPNVS